MLNALVKNLINQDDLFFTFTYIKLFYVLLVLGVYTFGIQFLIKRTTMSKSNTYKNESYCRYSLNDTIYTTTSSYAHRGP